MVYSTSHTSGINTLLNGIAERITQCAVRAKKTTEVECEMKKMKNRYALFIVMHNMLLSIEHHSDEESKEGAYTWNLRSGNLNEA